MVSCLLLPVVWLAFCGPLKAMGYSYRVPVFHALPMWPHKRSMVSKAQMDSCDRLVTPHCDRATFHVSFMAQREGRVKRSLSWRPAGFGPKLRTTELTSLWGACYVNPRFPCWVRYEAVARDSGARGRTVVRLKPCEGSQLLSGPPRSRLSTPLQRRALPPHRDQA